MHFDSGDRWDCPKYGLVPGTPAIPPNYPWKHSISTFLVYGSDDDQPSSMGAGAEVRPPRQIMHEPTPGMAWSSCLLVKWSKSPPSIEVPC